MSHSSIPFDLYIRLYISGNIAFASNEKRYEIDYLCALRFGWKGKSIHQSICRFSTANLNLRAARLMVQRGYKQIKIRSVKVKVFALAWEFI